MSGDIVKVGRESLEGMAGQITSTQKNLRTGFEDLSSELLRTLPEWGEGTASRGEIRHLQEARRQPLSRDV